MESTNRDVELAGFDTTVTFSGISENNHADDSVHESEDAADAAEELRAINRRLQRQWSSYLFNATLRGSFHRDDMETGWQDDVVLAYQSLGVVFGDLATSPLYVFPTIQLSQAPTKVDCLGILSIIFWTMTLVALVKYIFIVLGADDHGEGGTFALYSLLCQHANVGPGRGLQSIQSQSVMSTNLTYFPKPKSTKEKNRTRKFFENSIQARRTLLVFVIIGTCMVFGDGVLTPAISVLSAIGGIQTQFPAVSQTVVIVISFIILLLLFTFQRFGTRMVSFMFSPIMVLWCLSIFVIGIYNIAAHEPTVFKAISPHYIVLFFRHNHKSAWIALGGSVLCITGAEAMFADLGHFNRRAIQMAFLTMIYPSTIVAYAGETAYIIKHPEDHASAFFKSIPHGVFWPVFVIATLAAIVASQSLISAAFSVVKQSMALGCFPTVRLIHTSSRQEGQVYSPEINYLIMVLCLVVVIGFRDAAQIGNAFGVTVVSVMFLTTCLISLVMLIVWETPWYFIALFTGVYCSIEGLYFTSVLYKVPQGGWVPFAISFLFGVIMLSWNFGDKKKDEYEQEQKLGKEEFESLLTNPKVQRVPGICYFHTNLVKSIPPIIFHYVKNVRTLHQVIVFVTTRHVPVVTVLPSERFLVSRMGPRGVYRCLARYGYMDSISMEENSDFEGQLLANLKMYLQTPDEHQSRIAKYEVIRENYAKLYGEAKLPTLGFLGSEIEELEELAAAQMENAIHVLGKVRLCVHAKAPSWKKIVLKIFTLLRNNCREAQTVMRIPPTHLLEVGMVYEIK